MTAEVSTAAPARPEVFHHSCRAMGTRFSMVLPGTDAGQGEVLADFTESFLRSQERLMSRFDAHSPISELNRCFAGETFTPPPALWKILVQCRDHWQRTRGAFDITQLPLNQLWRTPSAPSGGAIPSGEAIAEVRARTGMERMQFDAGARTVQFLADGMAIDLGGFGKGYALEQLASYFRERGVARAFFSFGESSVTVIGSHPHGPAWPVGVANMFHPELAVHTFPLRDGSLSTSGTAPFNQTGGHAFGHTINPRTGRPIEGYRTMSVASPNEAEAEVLSTALLVTPEAERAEILKCYPGVEAVEIVYEPINPGTSNIEHRIPNIERGTALTPTLSHPMGEGGVVAFVPRIQWRYEPEFPGVL